MMDSIPTSFLKFKDKYHLQLNAQQSEAVCTVDGPVLLLAVPGSGKTTTLVSRLGFMIEAHSIAPESILTVTYTKAAAADMKQRFCRLFGEQYAERIPFHTINSLCYHIIQDYTNMISGNQPFDVASEDVRSQILRELYIREIKDYCDNLEDYNIEQLSAKILFELTRNTGFVVSKGSIGECWIKSCCDWSGRQNDDICDLDHSRLDIYEKMKHILDGTCLQREFHRIGLEVIL